MDVFKTLLLDTPDSLNAITGTLQIANGGTGATSAAGARDNLLPDYTGNVGKVLTVNAGATDVEWTTNGAGTVTSVDVSGGTTGLTTSGGPITASGTITLAGTLVVSNGGTGASTLTGYVKGTGTSALTASGTIPNTDITGLGTMSTQAASNVAITGGAIDGTTVGASTAAAGAFTTLGSSSTTTLNGTTIPASSTLLVSGGALGTPSSGTLTSCTGLPISTGVSGLGTDVATALAVNVGSSGAVVTNGGALGTPSSGTVTNLTGTASININGTVGATTPSTVAATTLSASGASTFPNSAPSVIGGLGFRNRIINGDMRIDQRNEGAAVTVNAFANFPLVDRFVSAGQSAAGVFTGQRSTSTPPAGFSHFLRFTTTTADSTPAAGAVYVVVQYIEGLNCQDLSFGSSDAKTVTLSFYVRSSLTGTFSGSLKNSAVNRVYPFEYTINAANTWERKTVVVTGDTTGTWLVDNGRGLIVGFDIGSGSTFRGTAGSWGTTNFQGTTGSVRLISTLSATLDFTGLQLEVGNAATEFERRPFGQELELCFRYFRRYASDASNHCLLPGYALANATTGGYGPVQLNPIMRDNPTLSVSAAADLSVDTSGTAAALTAVSIYGGYTTKNSVLLNFTVASGLTNGQAYMFRVNSGTGKHASFSAEL
jgi:hypothetical protein